MHLIDSIKFVKVLVADNSIAQNLGNPSAGQDIAPYNREVGPRAHGALPTSLLCGLPRLACGYGPLGEAEHVCTLRVLGKASAFLGWQRAIWIYLPFESLEECVACWACPRAPVVRATPRDFCRDPPSMMSLAMVITSSRLRSVFVSRLVSSCVLARNAQTRARGEMRR